jgi:transposase-like protein
LACLGKNDPASTYAPSTIRRQQELLLPLRIRGSACRSGLDGRLKQLTKTVLETALNEELTEHLGYGEHDPAGEGSGNLRNETRPKTVLTEATGPGRVPR